MGCAWSLGQGGFTSYFTEGRLILGIGPNGHWAKWVLDQMGIGPIGHWTTWILDQMGLDQLGLDEMGIEKNVFRRNGNKPKQVAID